MYKIYLIFILIFVAACENNNSKDGITIVNKKAIVLDSSICYFFPEGLKKSLNHFKFDTIDSGFYDFQCRIYYRWNRNNLIRLLIFKRVDTTYTIECVVLNTPKNEYGYSILKRKYVKKLNKSDLNAQQFISEYSKSQIESYPQFFLHEDMGSVFGGNTYILEFAKPGIYYHYYYKSFKKKSQEFKHIKLLDNFISYIDSTYGYYKLE